MSRVMRVLVFILVHLLLHAKLMWSGGQFAPWDGLRVGEGGRTPSGVTSREIAFSEF